MRGLVFILLCLTTVVHAQTLRRLDDFETLSPWEASASEGVTAAMSQVPGHEGRALRLDFDFAEVSGYAYARRALPLDLPENYEISFWLRGDAPVNSFQVKLTDAAGENVWWRPYPDFDFPKAWTRVTIPRRQIDFAWGPTADKTLRHAEKLEFVVARGRGGGKGSIFIDQLSLRALPPDPAVWPAPMILGPRPGAAAPAPNGEPGRMWIGAAGARSLTVDLGVSRTFGGLTLRWAPGRHASLYSVWLSDDAVTWRLARRVADGDGGDDPLQLPDAQARYLRLDLIAGPGLDYGLAKIEIEPLAFGATPTAFVETVARAAPRGVWPRGLSGEQAYWTLVGVDGGADSGLISEDGAVELCKGCASIEPFVVEDGRLVTWADATTSQSLQDGYLPIPSVTWRRPNWEMRVTAFAAGDGARSGLVARYDVKNLTDRPLALRLALAVRPLQVNGPRQFLGTSGGVSPIRDLAWDGRQVLVNGEARVFPLARPARFETSRFDAGAYPMRLLATGARPTVSHDDTGLASGSLIYELTLAPHGGATVGWVSRLTGAPLAIEGSPRAWLDRAQRSAADHWRAKLDGVTLITPPEGRAVAEAVKTSLAHILMSRHGSALQPGTRAYDRSWIRDGAMIAGALDRLGRADVAADYLRWYAPRQFATGKIPCCVDARGADPVAENDSQGEFIFLAAQTWRYTHDRALLGQAWPRVAAAADYMDALRRSERTDANRTPTRRMLFGLMPPSISHEGYSSKPAYSYWDDFWALRGYKDAVFIGQALGETGAATRFAASLSEFHADLWASLRAQAVAHGIGFLPGAADLSDFDATSTTIALAPGGEAESLPKDLLDATFERYWREFTTRRDVDRTWDAYTPYEWRNVGAFVRLGWRERANELLDFFLHDRRPLAWNGWAEVVGRDPRAPRFIGDLPHAWVASDYIGSVLDLFVFDRERDGVLVLGAGLPAGWFAGDGVGVRGLHTPYGVVNWTARRRGGGLVLRVWGDARPPGGYDFPWPFPGATGSTHLNANGEVVITSP